MYVCTKFQGMQMLWVAQAKKFSNFIMSIPSPSENSQPIRKFVWLHASNALHAHLTVEFDVLKLLQIIMATLAGPEQIEKHGEPSEVTTISALKGKLAVASHNCLKLLQKL